MTDTQVTWLTQESHDRLKSELNGLVANRPVIAAEINERREEGDLKENGGYHAAKDEQGKIEARIRSLTALLKSATVSEAPQSSGVVEPGTVIVATIMGDDEKFLLGSREIVGDGGELAVYSEQSPLGSAILGLKVGDSTSYEAPNGAEVSVTIVNVETYTP